MTISTKGRYGVKAMLDLALYSDGAGVSAKSIAERQNIPEKYLEQILSVLRKAGLIESIRGPSGGYLLSKPPEDITVGHILRALEGDLAPVTCVRQDKKREACKRSGMCITKYVWARVRDGVNQVIDGINLKDLAEAYENEILDGYMYYI
jgi:Rrf2 family cysteine metabolism transcriptional repressor